MLTPDESRPLRVFIYVQHLSGVGHMVRAQQLGLAFAQRHRVWILDGGRTVAFPPSLEPLSLPALVRREGELACIDGTLSLSRAFALRRERLQQMLREQRPDVVMVEHFPFSKWELAEEIECLLEHARGVNPGVTVVASLRDVSLPTRHEARDDYEERVLQLLQQHFDGLLVHADPQLCQLGDYFTASADIEVPVFHTGIVAAPIEPIDARSRSLLIGSCEYVVASVGGGADRAQLLPRVVRAWRQLAAAGEVGGHRLLLFGELDAYAPAIRRLIAREPSILAMGFDPDFTRWLHGADLSVSCAGYNTCANLLVTGTPALLVANPAMSDQAERARLMTECGIAVSVPPVSAGDDQLASLIMANLGGARTTHSIRLDGALQSARCIERWVSGLPGQ